MPPTRMLCFNATKMLCSSSTRVLCSSSHQCASLTRLLVCSMRDKKLCSHSDRSCANWARASMCSVAPSMAFIVSKSTGVNDCPAPVSADWCHSGSASVPQEPYAQANCISQESYAQANSRYALEQCLDLSSQMLCSSAYGSDTWITLCRDAER